MLNRNKRYDMIKRTIVPALTFAVTLQSTSTGVLAATTTINNLNSTKNSNETEVDYNRVISATRDMNKLFSEDGETLKVAVLSDPHYFPVDYVANTENQQYKDYMAKELYLLAESAEIFEAALKMVEADNPDILIIPGDMTKNGEVKGTKEVAYILNEFEKRTGIDVFLIGGNHDIESGAFAFNGPNGDKVNDIETVTIDSHTDIYGNFGYKDDEGTFKTEYFGDNPEDVRESKHPELSYVSRPKDGFVILGLNSEPLKDENGQKGKAGFNKDLLDWAVKQIEKAEENGETVIAMTHHGLLPHSLASNLAEGDAIIENWEEVAATLADAGLRYIFTGHMHENDIAEYTTPSGNTIYDIETASTAAYGSPVRSVEFVKHGEIIEGEANTKETVTVSSKSVKSTANIEDLQQYIYDFIYKDSRYLEIKLGGALGGISDALANISLEELIYGKTENQKLSLGEMINKAIYDELDGKSIKVDGEGRLKLEIDEDKGLVISQTSLGRIKASEIVPFADMDAFLLDLVRQIDDKVFNKDFLDKELTNVIKGILNIEIYKPETQEAKVLNDVINLFLIDHFLGAEVLPQWADESLETLRQGGIVKDLIDDLLRSVLGLLNSATEEIAFKPSMIIDDPKLVTLINIALGASNAKPASFAKLLKLLKVDPVDLLMKPIGELLDDYITPSFEKQMGVLIADLVYGLAGDDSQDDEIDGAARILLYEGTIAQEPTVGNGLLPHSIAVTFGEDETTEKAFSWYTGKNVSSNEIQFIEKEKATLDGSGQVDFSNGTTIKAESEIVKRPFPTVDLGIIAITKDKDVSRHQIVLNNLNPGTEYYYRVGNGEVYSKVATFETAAVNDESFTFLNFSDTQSMLESEYDTWASVVNTAFNKYPDAKFATHAGDMVDNGKNELQWQWFLNKPQEDLMSTSLITASGNHEEYADYSQTNHFNIQDLPGQDLKTGAYYKVDYGNALVMVLNTNNLGAEQGLSEDQVQWLKKTANESDAKWKIIQLHKAPYSNGSHYKDEDVVAIRAQLDQIVTELGIDLVLEGHDHTYARSEFLVNGEIEQSLEVVETVKDGVTYETAVKPEGTLYAITGTSGVKFYEPKETGLPLAFEPNVTDPVFAAITIDKDTLYYNAYTVNAGTKEATLLDKYAITKETPVVDAEAPIISGVENGGNYFVDRKVTATDNTEVVSLTVNGVEVESGYTIEASIENKEYTVVATDAKGNATTITFTMKALPTVNDIKLDEESKLLIENFKADFEASKAELSGERIEFFNNLIKALEDTYNVLENIDNVGDAIEQLPLPEEVTPEHVSSIKAMLTMFNHLTEEEKAGLGEEKLAKVNALEAAIKTSSLTDSTNKVTVEHVEGGYFEIDMTLVAITLKESTETFEITAMQNNVEVQPNGKIKVTIDLGDSTLGEDKVLELVNGVESTKLEVKVVDGKLEFYTDKLGTFKVTDEIQAPVVDKTELSSIIEKAESINTSQYTEASVKVLMEELEKAVAVLYDENASEEQVNNAVNSLSAAIENLEKVIIPSEVNKEELKVLLDTVSGIDISKYTEATVKAYNEALEKAKVVLNSENATQTEVNEAIKALRSAVENLEEKTGNGNGNGSNNGNGNENTGGNGNNNGNNNGNTGGSGNENNNGNGSNNGNGNESNGSNDSNNNGSDNSNGSNNGNNSSNNSKLPQTGGVSGFSLMAIGATLAGLGLTLRRKKI